MTRVASLYLPQLPIERLRRLERPARLPDRAPPTARSAVPPSVDDDPGACSAPRGGGWRPGARWARDGALDARPSQVAMDALPAHQRPTMREMGRRSEAANHPFHAMPPDEGASGISAARSPLLLPGSPRPLILVERIGQRDVIGAACPRALDLGLHPGMAAAHARALVSDLDVRDSDRAADQALLDRLALHAVAHWTPTACPQPPDGLWLDLTGTTHLFGGETRFCRRLLRFLARLGYSATIAIAGTAGAAHALARHGGRAVTILPRNGEAEALAPLPVSALRLRSEALAAAARFGIERIGDLYPMPRGPIARRLGLATVQRLDQALGRAPEPIVPVTPFEAPSVEHRLVEPIGTAEAIVQVIGDLADILCDELTVRGLGARAVVLRCVRVDGAEQRIGVGAVRATRDARHLRRMLAMRIERIEPGLGIETMGLIALRVEPLAAEALGMDLPGQSRAPDIAPLVDQLVGRVGENAVFRLAPVESDVPERAVRRTEPLDLPTGWPAWARPVRLLSRPEALSAVVALLPDHPPRRFAWRGRTYQVSVGDGPERIHGEWWRSDREMWAVRDYFRVETSDGQRFWLFRRGDGVEPVTGDLSWYMHGMFG